MTPGRLLLACVFLGAGIAHFAIPAAYLRIMPAWVPAPLVVVYFTGLCEFLGGAGLLVPSTRRLAAWGLVAFLIAVLPANIHMALDHTHWHRIPAWVLWARVPLQLPLIWWAWLYTR